MFALTLRQAQQLAGRTALAIAGLFAAVATAGADAAESSASLVDVTQATTETPAPNAPPVTGPANTPPRAEPPRAGARFGHLPIIDIIPIYTQPQFYDARVTKGPAAVTDQLKNAGVGYDPVDVGGTVRIPITADISASFDRIVGGTLDVPNARVTSAAAGKGREAYTYPAFSRGSVVVYRLDEQYRRFTVEEGLFFRHRIVGGASTSHNPYRPTIASSEAHFGYFGVTYVSAPIRGLLYSFVTLNMNADTQAIDHHVGCGTARVFVSGNFTAPCVNGVWDPNPKQNRIWGTDQYVQFTVPIDRKHGVTAVAQDRWGALNFYENAPFPYRYTTSQTYILTKRFDRVFALSVRIRAQWAVPSGVPFVKPNAQHNGTVDVLADFRVDTNNLH